MSYKRDIAPMDENGDGHGHWILYHKNGNIMYDIHYHHGNAIGKWELHYENGNLKYKGEYSMNGGRVGLWEFFHESGLSTDTKYYIR